MWKAYVIKTKTHKHNATFTSAFNSFSELCMAVWTSALIFAPSEVFSACCKGVLAMPVAAEDASFDMID